MTTKLTQGPWRVVKANAEEMPEPAVMAGEMYVATIYDTQHDGTWAEAEANARLIANAPALLEALDDIRHLAFCSKVIDGPDGEFAYIEQLCEKAIKAATGRKRYLERSRSSQGRDAS